jgi:uncharacterized protein YjlB
MAEPQILIFAPDGGIPNSRLPLLFWRGRLMASEADGEAVCSLYRRNGWAGTWVYTVFPFWHFHTKGHEVLSCVSGSATIGLGGEAGAKVEVAQGDVVVIPAGVGHRRLAASSDFLMAGGYPPGQSGDIVRPGDVPLAEAERAVEAVELPQTDPIDGGTRELPDIWRSIPAAPG